MIILLTIYLVSVICMAIEMHIAYSKGGMFQERDINKYKVEVLQFTFLPLINTLLLIFMIIILSIKILSVITKSNFFTKFKNIDFNKLFIIRK